MMYEEALAYLLGLQRFGIKPGLDRTAELLRRVGRPDRRAGRIIHITGTSGKGSVAALVESSLRAAGFRTGLYTSPSLERFNDRIQVDRVQIPDGELAVLVGEVQPHVAAMVDEGLEQPTEFEVTTVVAFLYFARQQVDWLVLEVGLGGRFDATTAMDNPVVSCITNIGLDHTEWLGTTHEQIAWDKAGIIKPAVPCVTGTTHPGALAVIREVSASNSAVLVEVTAEDHIVVKTSLQGQVVDLLGARGWYRGVELGLLGEHQASNGAVALRVLELAGITDEAIRQGFRQVKWMGRFEVIARPGGPTILLDAAHNPAKCEALAEAVQQYFPGYRANLVLGVLADKDVRVMVRPLLALASQVWVTTPESPRALPAGDLAEVCAAFMPGVHVEVSLTQAVQQALAASKPTDLVIITGSFYTVGPARKSLWRWMGQE